MLGLYLSVSAAVVWASIPLVCKNKTLGTAFGVLSSLENVGMFIGTISVSKIMNETLDEYGYFYYFLFFCLASEASILISFWIISLDKKMGGVLDAKEN